MGFSDFFFYPDYYGLVKTFLVEMPEYYSTEPVHPDGFLGEVRTYCEAKWSDLYLVVLLAITWTILRYLLTLFVLKPTALSCNLTKGNVTKMAESSWRMFFYVISWSYVAYVVSQSEFDIFGDPPSIFKGWQPAMVVPPLIYWAYAIECSFYLHCFFATIFLDVWRSDSVMLVMHHVLTLSLIGFSYASRYHNVGILVLFCHDFCDICLEFSKINIYFKIRADGTFHGIHEFLANVGFVVFTSSWLVLRMYWFPLKVLYSILPSTAKIYYTDHLPFGMEFNIMLWLLFGMDIYWFSFIVIFLVRIVTGSMKELEDIREETDEEVLKIKKTKELEELQKKGGAETTEQVCNGVVDGTIKNGDGLKQRHPHPDENGKDSH
ncbi:ceramide synthase 1-like [Acanthaster planci]|uniref:Ceramide synthase 1-like n=1 Tax=Acanthaster planci TaxID=133434 RepID=A0A8B7Z968_ACAPL|nr:ceramide synthase 1-like [Acanthaster planci]